jgi:hypothetical protein
MTSSGLTSNGALRAVGKALRSAGIAASAAFLGATIALVVRPDGPAATSEASSPPDPQLPRPALPGTGFARGKGVRAFHIPRPLPADPEFPTAEAESPYDDESEQEELERKIVLPFAREMRDASWASATERRLEAEFDDYRAEHDLHEARLDRVECRTTTCSLRMSYTNDRVLTSLQDQILMRRVVDIPGCVLHSLGIDRSPEEPTQDIYFTCAAGDGVVGPPVRGASNDKRYP